MAAAVLAAEPLPALGIDPSQVSVSGVSAGAFMAMQVHVARSAAISGAAIVAGGPWFCAGGDPAYAPVCRGAAAVPPNPTLLFWAAAGRAAAGAIDDPANLRRSRVYLFSGTADDTVTQTAMDAVHAFYVRAGVPRDALAYVRDVRAGHGFVAPTASGDCAASEPPWLNRCTVDGTPYDMAGAILAHLHGPLRPAAPHPAGRRMAFDQRPFATPFGALDDSGDLFVPTDCETWAGCRLHIAFHGCAGAGPGAPAGDGAGGGAGTDGWLDRAGYERWAAGNRIVLLYPRVKATAIPYNPNGCWDWWGYTGPGYATRDGLQTAAVMRMVETLAGIMPPR